MNSDARGWVRWRHAGARGAPSCPAPECLSTIQGALRSLIPYDPAPPAEARSELELRFLDLTREAGLPAPEVNVLVGGFLVDAYWPSAGVVVELQSYAHHSGREAFERDHARQARLKLAGYEVLALTWRQVTKEPAWVAGAVGGLLGGR